MAKNIKGQFVEKSHAAVAWIDRMVKPGKKVENIGTKIISVFGAVTLLVLGGYMGYSHSIVINQALAEAKTEVPAKVEVPPFLLKIAKCESKTGQYGKNGQVQINPTMDIGKYQINVPAQGARATKMGYDLSKPEDNEAYAIWLFNNEGTKPWKSSANCWDK